MSELMSLRDILDSGRQEIYDVVTRAGGAPGELPLAADFLTACPSGDLFGLIQDVGMGWEPARAGADGFLILSHQGGLRGADGKPVALGFHCGHY